MWYTKNSDKKIMGEKTLALKINLKYQLNKKHYCFGCAYFFKSTSYYIKDLGTHKYLGFKHECGDEMEGVVFHEFTEKEGAKSKVELDRDISDENTSIQVEVYTSTQVHKRGRPAGSKNKSTLLGRSVAVTASVRKKRGRPKKNA